MRFPKLAEGSEHLVLFDGATSEVVKITLPGTYGDYYEIIADRISQFDCTPAEYLLRMHWWEELFSTAPAPIGMTESGQIVSRQRFIQGDPLPPQETVDQFLVEAGAVAVLLVMEKGGDGLAGRDLDWGCSLGQFCISSGRDHSD